MLRALLFTFFLCVLIGLQACSPKSQKDCGFVQNVYGERISWKGNLPVVMHLHESVPAEYATSMASAAETWNRSAGRKVIEVRTDQRILGDGNVQKDNLNVIYFNNSWEGDKSNEQARTSVYWIGDQIKETDIKINSKDFSFYTNQKRNEGGVNIEALVLHEMGHVLGLKHKDTEGSVMATYLASNSDRVQVQGTDIDALKCEY
jgi:hypothetical protein